MYPLVRELAADGIPVAVTCRVLKIARQPYYRWLAEPGHRRRAERRTGPTRCSTPTATTRSSATGSWSTRPATPVSRWPSGPRGGSARTTAGGARSARSAAATARSPARRSTTTWSSARLHRRRAEPAVAGRHHRAPHRRGQALPLRDQGRLLQPDRRLLDRLTDEVPAGGRGAGQRRRRRRDGGDVAGCVLHTDRGSQFRSRKFVRALNRHSMVGSMGRVGAAGDNAAMESFFALLQKNVLDRRAWATREELRIAIVTWIERTYHRRRRQAALGRLTPIEYETIMTTPPLRRRDPTCHPFVQQSPDDPLLVCDLARQRSRFRSSAEGPRGSEPKSASPASQLRNVTALHRTHRKHHDPSETSPGQSAQQQCQ